MLEVGSEPSILSERITVRFGATLIANLLRGGVSFVSGILIARGLGASGYGDLNFLLGSFAAISQLLEMGTASAFYTFISQRRRSRVFVALYLGWMVFQFVATLIVIGLVLPENVIDRVWVGHDRDIVLLAFGASFLMTQTWGMVSQLGESTRKTVIVQVGSVAQAVAHLTLVGAAMYWQWLTVPTVMWLLVGEYALLTAFFGPRLIQANLTEQPDTGKGYRSIVAAFTTYCKPMVLYVWVGFLYSFADRWLLQAFGGAEQQGFFAIGQQFANISLIATASILKISWKEIAEARQKGDHERIKILYQRLYRGLFFASAWMSCLLIPYSKEILLFLLGPKFEGAWLSLSLMFLYPILQSVGQIGGMYFYATEQTGAYAISGALTMIASIPVTYIILGPKSALVPGFELGAMGLALKWVLLATISISVQSYLIARAVGSKSDWLSPLCSLSMLLLLGYSAKWCALGIFGLLVLREHSLLSLLCASVFYGIGTLLLLRSMPWLSGLQKDQVGRIIDIREWAPASWK